jgi:hypothetical protein
MHFISHILPVSALASSSSSVPDKITLILKWIDDQTQRRTVVCHSIHESFKGLKSLHISTVFSMMNKVL